MFNRNAFDSVNNLRNRLFDAQKDRSKRESAKSRDKKRLAPKPFALHLESLEERHLLSAVSPFAESLVAQNVSYATESRGVDAVILTPDLSSAELEGTTLEVTTLDDVVDDSDGVLSLREAIDAAQDGDTIVFAQPGTITLSRGQLGINKSITIDATSVWDAENDAPGITIDANKQSRLFGVAGNDEFNVDAEFKGMNLVNGDASALYSSAAGGISVRDCSLTITNCTVSDNSTWAWFDHVGGGIYAVNCELTINNSVISNNSSQLGGGIYASSSRVIIADSSVSDNSNTGIYVVGDSDVTVANSIVSNNSARSGGGVYVEEGGTLTVTNSSFSNNAVSGSSSGYGGGIYACGGSYISIDGSVFSGNSAKYGGGIYTESNSTVSVASSEISGNSASYYGGGIETYGTLTFTNGMIYNNTARSGGGIDSYGSLIVASSTISGNVVESNGGGIYVDVDSLATVANTEISGNSAQQGGGIYSRGGAITISNGTVAGNSASYEGGGIYTDGSIKLFNTIVSLNCNGEISSSLVPQVENSLVGINPNFATPPVFSNGKISNLDSLNLKLTSSSIAIDRGSNEYCDWEFDLDDKARVVGSHFSAPIVDIGAYEYQETITEPIEVYSGVVTTNEDVCDPTDGKISLREALFYASDDETITFASSLNGTTIQLKGGELYIIKSVTIDASSLAQKITINGNQNSRVFCVNAADIFLDSIIITNGRAFFGGGIYVGSNGVLTVSNSVISGSSAFSFSDSYSSSFKPSGGGVYVASNGSLTMMNSEITGNFIPRYGRGGGIYLDSNASLTITNCSISRNSSTTNDYGSYGGGIYTNGVVVMTSCEISGNSAYDGGGIYVAVDSSVTIAASKISGNFGEGIYSRSNGSLTISNSSIFGNSDTGVYSNNSNGSLTISNSSVFGNSGSGIIFESFESNGSLTISNTSVFGNSGTGINFRSNGFLTVTNCTISGNCLYGISAYGSVKLYNTIISLNFKGDFSTSFVPQVESSLVGIDPVFAVPPVFSDGNITNLDNLDLRLTSRSIAIDHGSNEYCDSELDLDNKARVVGARSSATIVDIGAYEYQETTTEPIEVYSGVVTTNEDVCDPTDDKISLREALFYAPNDGTITFAPSLNGTTIQLKGGELYIIKSVTIDASSLSEKVIIDGERNSRVFYLYANSCLDSVVISNGSATNGGGVYAFSGTLTITNSVISGNSSSEDGGGIYVAPNASLIITNSSVVDNSTPSSLSSSSSYHGGGIDASSNSTVTIDNSVISGNSSDNGGGVCVAPNASLIITNSSVVDNFTPSSYTAYSHYGGGILAYHNSTVTIDNSVISNNSSKFGGGVFGASDSTITITNSTISGNSASSYGGGVFADSSDYEDSRCAANLYNTIVALNNNGDLYGAFSGDCVLTSNVWRVSGEHIYKYNPDLPLFVDAEDGDYRLAENSQAINLGSDEYAYEAGLDDESKDLANKPRFSGDSIDIGAYEYEQWFSKADLRNVWVGSFSFSLSSELPNASKVAVKWTSGIESGDVGLFNLPDSFSLNTKQYRDGSFTLTFDYLDDSGNVLFTENRTATIINDESIIVKRGKINADETWRSDKVYLVVDKLCVAPETKLTIEEGTVVKFWKNSYIDVASGANVDVGDGVIFTRAEDDVVNGDSNKDGDNSIPKFGGEYLRGDTSNVTIRGDVEFKYLSESRQGRLSRNETWFGGRVYHITGDLIVPNGTTLTLTPGVVLKFDSNCSLIVEKGGKLIAKGTSAQPIVFTSIYDDEYGGDIDDEETRIPSAGDWNKISCNGEAELEHCVVRYCSSGSNVEGGLEINGSGKMTFNNSVLEHTSYYGVAYSSDSCIFYAENSLFRENGTCMFNFHARGRATLVNCTIADCSDLINIAYRNDAFYNCVIANVRNAFHRLGSTVKYDHCLFWNSDGVGPQSFSAVGQNGNIWADPMFRAPVNGDYRLRAGSPCIDAANGALAPSSDADGVARATNPYSAQSGVSTPDGVYADIGAYEFGDFARSSFDLEPISLTAPASAVVGDDIVLVQWTIRNNGTAAVDGMWRDEIWLVDANGRETFVKTVYTTDVIAPGDLAVCSSRITIPAAVDDGNWTFIVRVNANRDVYEGVNVANNELRAEATTAIQSPFLAESGTIALSKGESKLFRVDLPAGTAFFFNGTSDRDAELYWRENAAPTATLYDSKAAKYGENGISLYVEPAGEARTFYLLAKTDDSFANIEYTIRNDAALEVVGISRSSASNLGSATLSIVGSGLTADTLFELKNGDSVVTGTGVVSESGSSVAATFDLTDVPAGKYDLVATLGGTSSVLAEALEVTDEGVGAVLETYLNVPSAFRAGRIYQGTITYSNVGDADMLAPIIVVSEEDGLLGYSSGDATRDRIYFMGAGAPDSAGVLRAGETYSVDFYFKPNDTMRISLSAIDSSDEDLEADVYNQEYWTSWGDYYEDLASALTQWRLRGNSNVDYKSVDGFLLAQKKGENTTGVSGRLTDAATGQVISGAVLQALWGEDDGETEFAITDENGRYVFNYLPASQNITINLCSKGTDLSETSVQTLDVDVTNFDLTATAYGNVSGRVVSNSNRSVENLFVFATSETGETALASTDRWGAYSLNDLTPGKWTLTLYADGCVGTIDDLIVDVAPLQSCATGTNFTLPDGVGVSGKVVDASGNPVSEAYVVLYDDERELGSAITDSEGKYLIYGFNVAEASVKVQADGFATSKTTVSFADATDVELDITLDEGLTFSGTVTTTSGANAVGCLLALRDVNDGVVAYSYVDAYGTFALENLPVGNFELSVYSTSNALVWSSDVEIVSDQNVANYAITLNLTSIVGKVSDASGSPVEGATLILSGEGDQCYYAMTNELGKYRFENVPSGAYSLQIVGSSTVYEIQGTDASVVQDVTLPYSAKCEVNFLSGDFETSTKEIRVFRYGDDGKPVFANSFDVITDSAAFYLKDGQYDFYASCEEGIFTPLLGVNVAANSTIVWNAQLGTNSINVEIDASELPQDEGAIYYLSRVDSEGEILETIQIDREKVENCELSGLIDGSYVLETYVGNYHAKSTFAIDNSNENVTPEFEELASAKIRVSLPEGADVELEDAFVALYDSDNDMVGFAFCNEDGEIDIKCFPVGDYTAIVNAGGYAASTTISLSSLQTTEIQVNLNEAPIVVSGRVLCNGQNAEGIDVYVVDESLRILGFGFVDENGNARISSVESESGKYILSIHSDLIQPIEIELDVASRKANFGTIELTLKEQSSFSVNSANNSQSSSSAVLALLDYFIERFLNNDGFEEHSEEYQRILSGVSSIESYCECDCTDVQSVQQFQRQYNEAQKSLNELTLGCEKIRETTYAYSLNIERLTYELTGAVGDAISLIADIGVVTGLFTVPSLIAKWGGNELSLFSDISAFLNELEETRSLSKTAKDHMDTAISHIPEATDAVLRHNASLLNDDFENLNEAQKKLKRAENKLKDHIENPAINKDGSTNGNTLNGIKKQKENIAKARKYIRASTASNYFKWVPILGIEANVGSLINHYKEISDRYVKAEELYNSLSDLRSLTRQSDYAAKQNVNLAKNLRDQTEVCECDECQCAGLNTPSLRVNDVGKTYISVSWTPVQNATVYLAQATRYSTFSNPKWARLHNSTAYTFSGLKEDTLYHMRVKALGINGGKDGKWSSVVSAKTKKSEDPNEIVGPIGADFVQTNYGAEDEPYLVIETPNWIACSGEAQNYRIFFENKSTATASAQEVTVDLTLAPEWDWTTFEASSITVGGEVFALSDENRIANNVWLVDQESTGAKLRIETTVNDATGTVRWYLRSWDETTTDHFPVDVYAGFLPPNDKTIGSGEGNVAFSVRAKDGLTSGTRVETKATIVFDANESIDTNLWVNTYDVDAPTASFTGFSSLDGKTIELTWTGYDEHSGIGSFDLFYSVDGGTTFESWISTDETTATFEQVDGYVDYVFKLVPHDAAGNVGAETTFAASVLPIAPSNLTIGNFVAETSSVTVSWTDNSSDETGFLVQYSSDGETWTDIVVSADVTSATLTGLERGATYAVRVAATYASGSSMFVSSSFATGPDAPTSLSVVGFDEKNGLLVVNWTDVADSEDGYLVEESPDGGLTWTPLALTDADEESATIPVVDLGKSFLIRVSAFEGGCSSNYAYAQVLNLPSYSPFTKFELMPAQAGALTLVGVNKDGFYVPLEVFEYGADFYLCVLGKKSTQEDFTVASEVAALRGRIDFVDSGTNNTITINCSDGDDLIVIGTEIVETTEQYGIKNPYEKLIAYYASLYGEDSMDYLRLKAQYDKAYKSLMKKVKTVKSTWGTISIEGGTNVRFFGAKTATVNAGDGNDVVKVDSLGFGYVVSGGEGDDKLTFADAAGAVKVSLDSTSAQSAIAKDRGKLQLKDAFETFVGSVYNDTITGSSKGTVIDGNGGSDKVTLVGGVNDVTLTGPSQSVTVNGTGTYHIKLEEPATKSTIRATGAKSGSLVTVEAVGDKISFTGGSGEVDVRIEGNEAVVKNSGTSPARVVVIGDKAKVTTAKGDDYVKVVGDNATVSVGDGDDVVEVDGAGSKVTVGGGVKNDVTLAGERQTLTVSGDGTFDIKLTNATKSAIKASGVKKTALVTVEATGDQITFTGGSSAIDVSIAGDAAIVKNSGELPAVVVVNGANANVTTGKGDDDVRVHGDSATINVGDGNDRVEITDPNSKVTHGRKGILDKVIIDETGGQNDGSSGATLDDEFGDFLFDGINAFFGDDEAGRPLAVQRVKLDGGEENNRKELDKLYESLFENWDVEDELEPTLDLLETLLKSED